MTAKQAIIRGDKAGQRGTHDAHLKVEDEHGVAADVHHVHHQTGQHADLAVALCAEERRTGVVHTDEGIAQRREQEIRLGVAHDVGVNGAEDAPQDAVPPHRHHGGDHDAERDHDEQDLGGGGLGVLRLPVADVLAGDDGAAGGKRAEQLDHQHVERVHQADARHGCFADRGDHQGIGQTDGHAERLLGDQRQQQGDELFAGKQRLGCCGCHKFLLLLRNVIELSITRNRRKIKMLYPRISKILRNKVPSVPFTPAVGCDK